MKIEQKAEQTILTSARIPTSTLKALQRRAKRLNISQNKLIIVLLNQGLGLGDEDFNVNPPLPTDEAIANLQARLEVVEKHLNIDAIDPFVSEPIKPEEALPIIAAIAQQQRTTNPENETHLLTLHEAVQLAIGRGFPDNPQGKTPATKRLTNKFTDYANGKSKQNPEELYQIRRVKVDGQWLFEDLQK